VIVGVMGPSWKKALDAAAWTTTRPSLTAPPFAPVVS
jgi:hypothetical protein